MHDLDAPTVLQRAAALGCGACACMRRGPLRGGAPFSKLALMPIALVANAHSAHIHGDPHVGWCLHLYAFATMYTAGCGASFHRAFNSPGSTLTQRTWPGYRGIPCAVTKRRRICIKLFSIQLIVCWAEPYQLRGTTAYRRSAVGSSATNCGLCALLRRCRHLTVPSE